MLDFSSGLAVTIAAAACAATAAALLVVREKRQARRQIAALHDESEHLRDEIWQARESEEHYRGLVEAQNDLILRRGPDGRIIYANAAFLHVAGPGRAIVETPFVLPALRTGAALVTEDGARNFDQEIETAQGRRWISWLETEVRDTDGRIMRQSVGRDITERRAAEEAMAGAHRKAQAASAAKSRFLTTVSHELRTPLSGVLGMADLLLDTGLSPEQATYANAVKSSSETLLSLIGEILDFSKIESGKLELAQEPFDLTPLVEGVAELLAPRAQGKGIEIASCIAPETPRRLVGDPVRLRQVLLNLAGNAVKFSATGGVGISVAAPSHGKLVFRVADTGEGIPADRLERIFEEFEQGESGKPGAGLGLSISRRLVAMMGGSLEVESVPGRGSTFTATIPLAAADGRQAPRGRLFPVGSRALVVARSPFEAPFLCEKLRGLGFDVDHVGDGSQALALLGGGPAPELVVVDAAIGEMAARTVAGQAAARGAKSCLVLLSPFEKRQLGAPSAFGFTGYLVKPIRERSLDARLLGAGAGSPQAGARLSAKPPAAAVRVPLHVLIAEDDEVNALLATRLLERAGATVELYGDGLAALDAAIAATRGARPGFDLALLDIRMPGLDGNEVARRLRGEESRLNNTPLRLVALTANAFPEDRASAQAAGFDEFLVKPVMREDLLRLLAQQDHPPAKVA